MTELSKIAQYQKKLRPGISIKLGFQDWSGHWTAMVFTEENRFPHWQQASSPDIEEAWQKLRGFLDGNGQLHGAKPIHVEDFLLPVGQTEMERRPEH